jgi:soluble lytic murein transglycosylase
MSMIIRISIPLLLTTSTYFIFLCSLSFASIAALNEKDYNEAVVELAEVQKPSLGYEVVKVLKSRTRGFSHFELLKTADSIIRYSKENNHDPFLLMAVIDIESNFRRTVVSSKGAVGFMQIRPFVARGLARELNIHPDFAVKGLRDVDTNVMIGSYYLAKMRKRFGDLSLALEAYNLGPTRLNIYIRDGVKLRKNYAKKVLRSKKMMLRIVRNRA